MRDLPISRRALLKGLGVSMALPFLEGMLPKLAYGQSQALAQAFPRRMGVIYFPMGVNTPEWTVNSIGRNFALSKIQQPLAPYRDDILVLSGLTCDKARPHGSGTGDHARAQASFLTGKIARKSTTDIFVGQSMDQLCADRIGNRTRFPSLEIGAEGGRQSGGCDPGYACAYASNVSWRGPSTPAPKETNPRAIFDRLFASSNPSEVVANRQRRERYNQSILDFVLDDARALNNQVGLRDQQRVDEYLNSVRDVERRITTFLQPLGNNVAAALERPDDIRVQANGPAAANVDYRLHLRVLSDLLAVAFQTDMTRICTYVFSNEINNRAYRMIDVPDGHHDISHHQFDPARMRKYSKINVFHVEQFAYLVGRLKSIPEGNGTLLDNCMVLYGSGNGDGALHNHDELPIVLAGKGGGTISTGRHIRYARETPLCNLFLEMMDRMGVVVDSFGDSTGRLRNLA